MQAVWGAECPILKGMVRDNLSEKVTFEQRFMEEHEYQMKSLGGRSLAYLRMSKNVAGKDCSKERSVRYEIRYGQSRSRLSRL